ncbi:MAG: FAD-binding oxidoreductase [Nitrospirota bacterium]
MGGKELQSRIEGKVTTATDAGYEPLRRAMNWNQLTPMRYPQLIVQVATESDVVEAVRFARTHEMKIAVRGGGHSCIGAALCDESLLIDLGRLNQVSIDSEARVAAVQPAVTGRDLNHQLALHGLAFPVGHCPTVPLSGFLLNGGLGFNSNRWGPACFSLESATVVTAEGNIVVANPDQHADLLWAARGAGPGFFAVATQYVVKLYQAPRAITTSTYYYPLRRIEEVGAWAGSIARQMPSEVELTFFIVPAPPALAEQCRSSNGFMGILSATAFVDTAQEAIATLSLLKSCPVVSECLQMEVNQPTRLAALLEKSGSLWPERHRYLAESLWSDSPPAQVLGIMRDYFLQAPSAKSVAICTFSTGVAGNSALVPEAAFSMSAETLLLCYAIWERSEDDASNAAWHRKMIAALDPFAVGHYVGESDILSDPARAERSFAPTNWRRLQALRRKYDPDALFQGDFHL